MRKISFSIIVQLLRLSFKFLSRTQNFILAVVDLLDDGVVNNSADVPEWCKRLTEILDSIQNALDFLTQLDFDLVDKNKDLIESSDAV